MASPLQLLFEYEDKIDVIVAEVEAVHEDLGVRLGHELGTLFTSLRQLCVRMQRSSGTGEESDDEAASSSSDDLVVHTTASHSGVRVNRRGSDDVSVHVSLSSTFSSDDGAHGLCAFGASSPLLYDHPTVHPLATSPPLASAPTPSGPKHARVGPSGGGGAAGSSSPPPVVSEATTSKRALLRSGKGGHRSANLRDQAKLNVMGVRGLNLRSMVSEEDWSEITEGSEVSSDDGDDDDEGDAFGSNGEQSAEAVAGEGEAGQQRSSGRSKQRATPRLGSDDSKRRSRWRSKRGDTDLPRKAKPDADTPDSMMLLHRDYQQWRHRSTRLERALGKLVQRVTQGPNQVPLSRLQLEPSALAMAYVRVEAAVLQAATSMGVVGQLRKFVAPVSPIHVEEDDAGDVGDDDVGDSIGGGAGGDEV